MDSLIAILNPESRRWSMGTSVTPQWQMVTQAGNVIVKLIVVKKCVSCELDVK